MDFSPRQQILNNALIRLGFPTGRWCPLSEILELLTTTDLGWQLLLAGAILLGLLILQALFFAILRSSGEDGFDASRLVPSFCQALRFPLGLRGDGDFGGDGGD